MYCSAHSRKVVDFAASSTICERRCLRASIGSTPSTNRLRASAAFCRAWSKVIRLHAR
jgi:hypothetical protein